MISRAPFQVLVMPFRWAPEGGLEFAALLRADDSHWQGIAGGGLPGESPTEAARREASEEAGLSAGAVLYQLDSQCSIPREHFPLVDGWDDSVFVIPEHSYAVDCSGLELCLSPEHLEVRWGSYETITTLLHWDSNRTALWELRERLLARALNGAA